MRSKRQKAGTAAATDAGEAVAEKKPAERKDPGPVARRILIKLIALAAIGVAVLHFVVGIYRIDGNDMYPSIRDGDLVVTFKPGGSYAGDVIVFKDAEGCTHCGRVAAVAGDTINIVGDGYYEINGSIPYESIFYPTEKRDGTVSYPYQVKSGEVFVLGDMRQQAVDSRTLGAIPVKQIRGKVRLLLFRGRGF